MTFSFWTCSGTLSGEPDRDSSTYDSHCDSLTDSSLGIGSFGSRRGLSCPSPPCFWPKLAVQYSFRDTESLLFFNGQVKWSFFEVAKGIGWLSITIHVVLGGSRMTLGWRWLSVVAVSLRDQGQTLRLWDTWRFRPPCTTKSWETQQNVFATGPAWGLTRVWDFLFFISYFILRNLYRLQTIF